MSGGGRVLPIDEVRPAAFLGAASGCSDDRMQALRVVRWRLCSRRVAVAGRAYREILVILAIAMAMLGCATLDSVQPGAGGSTFEVRGRSYDAIWKAAVRVAGQSLTIVESDKATGTLRAEKGMGLATWGEVVGIFIRAPRSGAAVYTVEVVSLKRSQLQITGQDWTTTIISGMKAELDQ